MNGVNENFTPAARLGLKGRDVPAWLTAAGIAIPSRPNGCARTADGGWCLRLGVGEYVLAHDEDPRAFETLLASQRPARVHALLRSDRCVRMHGPDATARLLQVCDFDDRVLTAQPDALALLAVADVSVALHVDGFDDTGPRWRLWCDPTYVAHLEHSLSRTSPTFPRLT